MENRREGSEQTVRGTVCCVPWLPCPISSSQQPWHTDIPIVAEEAEAPRGTVMGLPSHRKQEAELAVKLFALKALFFFLLLHMSHWEFPKYLPAGYECWPRVN